MEWMNKPMDFWINESSDLAGYANKFVCTIYDSFIYLSISYNKNQFWLNAIVILLHITVHRFLNCGGLLANRIACCEQSIFTKFFSFTFYLYLSVLSFLTDSIAQCTYWTRYIQRTNKKKTIMENLFFFVHGIKA